MMLSQSDVGSQTREVSRESAQSVGTMSSVTYGHIGNSNATVSESAKVPHTMTNMCEDAGILKEKVLIRLTENSMKENCPKIRFEHDLGGGIVIKTPTTLEAAAGLEDERKLVDSFTSSDIFGKNFGYQHRKKIYGSKKTRADWMNIYSESMYWLIDKGLEALNIFTHCEEDGKKKDNHGKKIFLAMSKSKSDSVQDLELRDP